MTIKRESLKFRVLQAYLRSSMYNLAYKNVKNLTAERESNYLDRLNISWFRDNLIHISEWVGGESPLKILDKV